MQWRLRAVSHVCTGVYPPQFLPAPGPHQPYAPTASNRDQQSSWQQPLSPSCAREHQPCQCLVSQWRLSVAASTGAQVSHPWAVAPFLYLLDAAILVAAKKRPTPVPASSLEAAEHNCSGPTRKRGGRGGPSMPVTLEGRLLIVVGFFFFGLSGFQSCSKGTRKEGTPGGRLPGCWLQLLGNHLSTKIPRGTTCTAHALHTVRAPGRVLEQTVGNGCLGMVTVNFWRLLDSCG